MGRQSRLNPVVTLDDATALFAQLSAALTPTIKTVKTDDTGDFTTVKAASDWITAQSPSVSNQFEVRIYPGVYTDINWILAPYTTLRAMGRLGSVWIKGELPDSTDDTSSTNNSTFWIKQTCSLIGLKITAKNMRYPVHSEGSGTNTDAVHTIEGCWIEHYGNQGIVDYRVANSLPAGAPWLNCLPWGYGSASGVIANFTDTTFIGTTYGSWYIHNREDFTKPTINTLARCRFITTDPTKPSITIQSLGSGRTDRVDFIDCEFSGGNYIDESDTPWISTTAAGQYANHSDIRVRMFCGMLGFKTSNRGKALKIESASTSSTSTVRVSGTAAAAIIGANPSYRDGGGGLKGYLWGDLDISGILTDINSSTTVDNTLGRRLGDCSSVSKTLTVTVDGGAPIDVVFNTNLTAVSNATIISSINTALGAAATASEYLVSQGEVYPEFLHRQETLVNSDTVYIPRWAAVKKVSGKVQLMATGDAASLCHGITLEPIPPGKYGRILTEGLLLSTQLAGAPTVTLGAAMYHDDSNAGRFATSGTRVFGVGEMNGFCYFKGNR